MLSRHKRKRTLERSETASTSNLYSKVQLVDSKQQNIDDPESVFSQNTHSDPQTSNQADQARSVKLYSACSISQMFNQFMFTQKCISEKKLNRLFEEYKKLYLEGPNKTFELQALINRYNKLFRSDGLQIKRTYDLIGHAYYYVLSGTFHNKFSKLNTFSQKESGYYFLVLDNMFTSFLRATSEDDQISDPESVNYSFLSIAIKTAVNLSRPVTSTHVTMTMAEKLLDRWVHRKWFAYLESGRRITVGVRTLTLMSHYLHNKFSIFLCHMCTFTCLIGITCQKCHLCIHYHCLEAGTAGNHPCPTCHVPMSGVKYLVPNQVHEEMEDEDEE